MTIAVPVKSLWIDVEVDDPAAAVERVDSLLRKLASEPGIAIRGVSYGRPLVAAHPHMIAEPAKEPLPRVNRVIGGSYHTRPRAR